MAVQLLSHPAGAAAMASPWLMTSPRQGLVEVEYSMVTWEGSMPDPVPIWMGPVMMGSHSEPREAPP